MHKYFMKKENNTPKKQTKKKKLIHINSTFSYTLSILCNMFSFVKNLCIFVL